MGVRLYVGHGGLPCPLVDQTFMQAVDSRDDDNDQETTSSGVMPDLMEVDVEGDSDDEDDLDKERPALGKGKARELPRRTRGLSGHNTFSESGGNVSLDDGLSNDSDWEDAGDVDPSAVPLKESPSKEDDYGNHLLLIVDVTGLHFIHIVWCKCAHARKDLQLLKLHLFPATTKEIKTVFTFRCLDDYRISSLETKASAYQYFNKLRRITSSAFPHSVTNRYAELRRVAREWRNLKYLKWNGFGHNNKQPGRGNLALFCGVCPQPNVNLPADWETKYQRHVFHIN